MNFQLPSNTFFRSLVAVCLFTSISMMTSAQSQGDERPDKPGPQHLIEALQVTEDQQDSFLTVMKAQHEKRMNIHEQYRDNHEEERTLMTALHKETLTLLQNVLTAKQLETFTSMEKQKPSRKPRH